MIAVTHLKHQPVTRNLARAPFQPYQVTFKVTMKLKCRFLYFLFSSERTKHERSSTNEILITRSLYTSITLHLPQRAAVPPHRQRYALIVTRNLISIHVLDRE